MKDLVPNEILLRYEKLKKSINHYRYLFHVENKEEISGEALDSLKHELVQIEQQYPTIITADSPSQRVAGTALAKFKKVTHKVPQWSLNDAFDEIEIREFDVRIKRMLKTHTGKEMSPAYTCELKIDGLHMVLEYKQGMLTTAATRGDGAVGACWRRWRRWSPWGVDRFRLRIARRAARTRRSPWHGSRCGRSCACTVRTRRCR